jgi:hypothetical protein
MIVTHDTKSLVNAILNLYYGARVFGDENINPNVGKPEPFPTVTGPLGKSIITSSQATLYLPNNCNKQKFIEDFVKVLSTVKAPTTERTIQQSDSVMCYVPGKVKVYVKVDAALTEDSNVNTTDPGILFVTVNKEYDSTNKFVVYVKNMSEIPEKWASEQTYELIRKIVFGVIYDDQNITCWDGADQNFRVSRDISGAKLYLDETIKVYRGAKVDDKSSVLMSLSSDVAGFRPLWRKKEGDYVPAENNLREANFADIVDFVYDKDGRGLKYCQRCGDEMSGDVYGLVGPRGVAADNHMIHLICAPCGHAHDGVRELGYNYQLILRLRHPKTYAERVATMEKSQEWKDIHVDVLSGKKPMSNIQAIQYEHDPDELPQKFRNRYVLIGDDMVAIESPTNLIFSGDINKPTFKGRKIINLRIVGKIYSPKV